MPRTEFKTPKSARSSAAIQATATRLFVERGYDATTMRDIARECGMGLGALYYYFRSKEEIVLRFYEEEAAAATAAFDVWAVDALPRRFPDALAAFYRFRLSLLLPHRHLLRVAMRQAVDPESPLCPFHPASRAVTDANVAMLHVIVARTVPSFVAAGESGDWARALWLSEMAILMYWLYDRSPDLALTDQAIGLLARTANLARAPGLGRVRRSVFALIGPLFEQRETEK